MAVKVKTPEEILKRIQEGTETVPPQPHISFNFTEYVNTQTRITFVDAEFGEFSATPMDILRGKKKHPKRLKIQRGLSAEEVQKEVVRIHPYMRLDESTYKGLSNRARFIDEKFGEWWAEPQHVIKFHKSKHPRRDAFIRALPASEVQRRLTEGYQDTGSRPYLKIDPETYESVDKKARFIDEEFGEWWAFPNNIMKGQGHPDRSGCAVLTEKELLRRLEAFPHLEIKMETYRGVNYPCIFIDKEYGEFEARPNNVFNEKTAHPTRILKERIIPIEEAQIRVHEVNPEVSIDEESYRGIGRRCKMIDSKYGEWWTTPLNVIYGVNHPKTAIIKSKLEEYVETLLGVPRYGSTPDWLLPEKSKIKPDFKINEDIYMEADGIYWHSEKFIEDRYWHFNRRELFEKYGKKLFQFREDEILQKPEVVCSILKNAKGEISTKYFARKCEISKDFDAKEFFNTNHLMGFSTARSFCLKYGEEIVAAMSFKIIKQELHIVRFCTKNFTTVVGGFSKLLNHVIKGFSGTIVNFVDLRYGTGKHLYSLGFQLAGITLGWKWTDGKKTYNRLHCRANMDERKLTQAQHAKELGLYKIYDAGQAKYIKVLL